MAFVTLALLLAGQAPSPFAGWPNNRPIAAEPGERRLRNIRQLTFGGQNAEAYWSRDGRLITFQSTQPGYPDEQIFTMRPDGSGKTLRSNGLGRTTCSYFGPRGDWLYFSSTFERNPGPAPKPDMSKGYVWRVNPDFALYRVPLRKPGAAPELVLREGGYVAETTFDPGGRYMTFTSDFEGDLEIYRARLDGSDIRRLTNEPGYDGGPFVSWDGEEIVYRRDTLSGEADLAKYRALLKENLVRPGKLDIWIMAADGSGKRRVTNLGGASFAPFLAPDDRTIIFASNFQDPRGREFDLYTIGRDGKGLERITTAGGFDGFPMFSRDGRKLVWASNRSGSVEGETNLFVADWR